MSTGDDHSSTKLVSAASSKATAALLKRTDFDVICPICNEPFRPPIKEYNRSQRLGNASYCSRACSGQKRGNADQFDKVVPADGPNWYPRYILDLYQTARKGAMARGIAWYLDKDEFSLVVKRAAGRCQLTGIPFEGGPARPAHSKRPYIPSLDRIDANGPYSLENVQLIIFSLNQCFGDFGPEPIYRIAANLPAPSKIARPAHTYTRAPKGQRHYAVSNPTAEDEADIWDVTSGTQRCARRAVPPNAAALEIEQRLDASRKAVAIAELARVLTEQEQILGLGPDPDVSGSLHLRELRVNGAIRKLVKNPATVDAQRVPASDKEKAQTMSAPE